jgi:hypothetical protein
LLHQAQRERDAKGRIIATLEDYEVVRELVADLLAEGLDATISLILRETVAAVQELTKSTEATNYTAVARRLGLDKATALRRVRAAIEKGYVRNLEDRRGREARLVIGEQLPDDVQVLPFPDDLQGRTVEQGCNKSATTQAEWNEHDKHSSCMVAVNEEEATLPSLPQTVASVPFMITREMRQALADLHYSRDDIDRMTPQQAWEMINSNQLKGDGYVTTKAQAKGVELGLCPTCGREGILFSNCAECGEFIRTRQ